MEHLTHITGFLTKLFSLEYLPALGDRASLGLMFLFGLLTSFHCMGMCGGFVLSGSISGKAIPHNAVYNAGRVLSYTIVGGLAGGIGQVFSLDGRWKGMIPLLGGIFMILLSVKMLNVFPVLRRLNVSLPSGIAKRVFTGRYKSRLIIGLLSGLMPCGPLQMIQLYALGTKSVISGAISSFIFALGTVPLLFTFGAVNSVLFKKHTKIITVLSAVVILILGFNMSGRGLALAGIDLGLPFGGRAEYAYTGTAHEGEAPVTGVTADLQLVDSEIRADEYPVIVVKKGIKVRWNLRAQEEEINDCNNEIIIPDLNIIKKILPGDNVIEFFPEKAGDMVYTCWMGMIKSKIRVVD